MKLDIESKQYPVVTLNEIFDATVKSENRGYVFRILSSDFISFEAYSAWTVSGIKKGIDFKYEIFRERRKVKDSDFSFSLETLVEPEEANRKLFCLFYIEEQEEKTKALLALPFDEFKLFFYYLEQLQIKECLFKLESYGPRKLANFMVLHSPVMCPPLVSFRNMDIDINHLLYIHFKTKPLDFIKRKILESKADAFQTVYNKNNLLN